MIKDCLYKISLKYDGEVSNDEFEYYFKKSIVLEHIELDKYYRIFYLDPSYFKVFGLTLWMPPKKKSCIAMYSDFGEDTYFFAPYEIGFRSKDYIKSWFLVCVS